MWKLWTSAAMLCSLVAVTTGTAQDRGNRDDAIRKLEKEVAQLRGEIKKLQEGRGPDQRKPKEQADRKPGEGRSDRTSQFRNQGRGPGAGAWGSPRMGGRRFGGQLFNRAPFGWGWGQQRWQGPGSFQNRWMAPRFNRGGNPWNFSRPGFRGGFDRRPFDVRPPMGDRRPEFGRGPGGNQRNFSPDRPDDRGGFDKRPTPPKVRGDSNRERGPGGPPDRPERGPGNERRKPPTSQDD